MAYLDEYQKWLEYPALDPALKEELEAMKGNEKAIEDAFFAPLSFGTAGLRGVMGAGINRMNRYTVAQATKGLSEYILSFGKETAERGCAVCYDSRNNSALFSEIVARVLAHDGIRVFLFDELRPTPELSSSAGTDTSPASTSPPAIIPRSTTATRSTGRTALSFRTPSPAQSPKGSARPIFSAWSSPILRRRKGTA